MRKGFTMIELIFVIVIIGILAAVAIPRLAATRDDAEISKSLADLTTCIKDVGAAATAFKTEVQVVLTNLPSCTNVINDQIFNAAWSTDGTRTLTITAGSSTEGWAAAARTIATTNGLVTTHRFGGSQVDFD